MKTHQNTLMPAKQGLKGISRGLKLIAFAFVFVFSYTTVLAQSDGRISFSMTGYHDKIVNGLMTIKLRLNGADISRFKPEDITVSSNGRTESVPVKTMVMDGEYMLVTVDLTGVTNPGAPGVDPAVLSKFNLYGNLKEITIDNVSGVTSTTDNYNAIAVPEVSITGTIEEGSSYGVRQNNTVGGSASDNSNSSRGNDDGIITKDEVQGFVNSYPNPATGSISLRTTNNKVEFKEITLINAIGAKLATVKAEDEHLIKMDTSMYPSGVYFITIKTNYGDAVKRVVFVN